MAKSGGSWLFQHLKALGLNISRTSMILVQMFGWNILNYRRSANLKGGQKAWIADDAGGGI